MWMRSVGVTITSNDGTYNKVFANHRIDFEYHSTIDGAADFGTITLYNLSDAEIKALQSRKLGLFNVILQAGYFDSDRSTSVAAYTLLNPTDAKQINGSTGIEITEGVQNPNPTIFTGTITNVISYNQIPESIVHLYCVPQQTLQVTAMPTSGTKVAPNTTLQDAFIALGKTAGLSVKFSGLNDRLKSIKLAKGRVYHKTIVEELQQLCDEYSLSYAIRPTYIEIFAKAFGTPDLVSEIEKDSVPIALEADKVIGVPIATLGQLEVSVMLNTAILPGMILDASALIDPTGQSVGLGYVQYNAGYRANIDATIIDTGMSNTYQVLSVVHHGSTHAQNFQSDIVGIYGVDNTMGGTPDWRQWCAQAYDTNDSMSVF